MDLIIKTKKTTNFSFDDEKNFLWDNNLSWKAKGILIYLMSLPRDWHILLSRLCEHATDGRDSTYNGIRELIENGYCKRIELRNSNGEYAGCEYEISEYNEFKEK